MSSHDLHAIPDPELCELLDHYYLRRGKRLVPEPKREPVTDDPTQVGRILRIRRTRERIAARFDRLVEPIQTIWGTIR